VKLKLYHALRVSVLILLCGSLLASNIERAYDARPLVYRSFENADYKSFLNSFNVTAVKEYVKYFSSLGSRMTGYPGCEIAAEYITNRFSTLALENLTSQYYELAVPLENYATLELFTTPRRSFRVYTMEPNLVCPVIANITGPLIYVGDGELDDLNGKQINGCIAVMNYATGYNWVNLAKFGASAVLFLEPRPETISFRDNLKRSIPLPFNFPRYYVAEPNASEILRILEKKGTIKAHIQSSVTWQKKMARNIFAFLKGTSRPDLFVMITAHYDSSSAVPAVSPGANDAIGISTLLALAEYFSERRPPYSIMFVAFSGHHQGLIGPRWFFQDFLFGEYQSLRENLLLMISLEISSETNKIVMENTGQFYTEAIVPLLFYQESASLVKPLNDYLVNLVDDINDELGANYDVTSGMRITGLEPKLKQFPLGWQSCRDVEPLSICLGPAVSFTTVGPEDYLHSPIDTYENLNLDNLVSNVEAVTLMVYGIVSTEGLRDGPLKPFVGKISREAYWLRGRTVEYNESLATYVSVPNALLHASAYAYFHYPYPLQQLSWVIQTDNNGFFELPMLTGGYVGHTRPYRLQAFVISNITGNPIYAPTLGSYQWAEWSVAPGFNTGGDYDIGYYTLFECGTAVIFDVIYPQEIYLTRDSVDLSILNHESGVSPDSFGFHVMRDFSTGLSMATIYVEPNTRFDVLLKTVKLGSIPVAVLPNNSLEEPKGVGYSVDRGEQLVIRNTVLEYAKSLLYLDQYYYEKLASFGIGKGLEEKLVRASNLVSQAEAALSIGKLGQSYVFSVEAWAEALEIYKDLRNTTVDISQTIVFFAFVLIPFTFFFEKIVLGQRNKRRIISLLAVFAITYIILSFLHVGFSLASNSFLVELGIAILTLVLPVAAIFFSKFLSFIQKTAFRIKGVHEVEVSRGSAILLTFGVGSENLKRRKMRTSLTLISIILVVMSLVLFTSITIEPSISPVRLYEGPPYNGIQIRDPGLRDLGLNLYDFIKVRHFNNAIVTAYGAIYNPMPGDMEMRTLITAVHEGKTFDFFAFWALTPQEAALSWVNDSLIDGNWFMPEDYNVCILPDNAAEVLNVSIHDTVTIPGFNARLEVIGIVDSQKVDSTTDLNGEKITPLDPTTTLWRAFLSSKRLILVPLKWALRYMYVAFPGLFIYNIEILPNSPNATETIATDLFSHLQEIPMYAGIGDYTYSYLELVKISITGWESQIVLVSLAALILLNIMISSVYERTREIMILSTVGLSPFHIGFMFLAESMVYAVLGSVTGYLAAMLASNFAVNTLHANLSLNYSSSWVVVSLMVTMVVTLVSSLFAMLKAASLATPSLERVWRMETKPVGDQWGIPLPIVIDSEETASRLAKYLYEFMNTHRGESPIFSTKEISIQLEGDIKKVSSIVNLEPYESGISQRIDIVIRKHEEMERWSFELVLQRLTGEKASWERLNRRVIDQFRKQLLLWSSLSRKEKEKYATT